jgi:hypothetical protein
MFKIIRNGRRYGNKKFNTYEEARSYARKTLRKILAISLLKPENSRHPTLKNNGFSIAKI